MVKATIMGKTYGETALLHRPVTRYAIRLEDGRQMDGSISGYRSFPNPGDKVDIDFPDSVQEVPKGSLLGFLD